MIILIIMIIIFKLACKLFERKESFFMSAFTAAAELFYLSYSNVGTTYSGPCMILFSNNDSKSTLPQQDQSSVILL